MWRASPTTLTPAGRLARKGILGRGPHTTPPLPLPPTRAVPPVVVCFLYSPPLAIQSPLQPISRRRAAGRRAAHRAVTMGAAWARRRRPRRRWMLDVARWPPHSSLKREGVVLGKVGCLEMSARVLAAPPRELTALTVFTLTATF
eukprot:scaffold22056_cov113-Isochrysis_galbana.AAC.8